MNHATQCWNVIRKALILSFITAFITKLTNACLFELTRAMLSVSFILFIPKSDICLKGVNAARIPLFLMTPLVTFMVRKSDYLPAPLESLHMPSPWTSRLMSPMIATQ